MSVHQLLQVACLPQHYVVQDVLHQQSDSYTGRGGAAVHLHDLKTVRQLGGNSSSFPSAAEVRNTNQLRTCFCGLMQAH